MQVLINTDPNIGIVISIFQTDQRTAIFYCESG